MNRNFILAVTALTVALPVVAMAQDKNSLVGTWSLVSVVSKSDKGDVNSTLYGARPKGFVTYTADGRMSVVLNEDGRKPLSVNDRVSAPMEERAQAFSTMNAYAGTYTFSGNKLVHHVEVASIANWIGTNQERTVKMQGDRVTLSPPPHSRGGVMYTLDLTWERVKPTGPKARAPAH